MINLEKVSGLPIDVGPDYQLKFKNDLPEVKPAIRMISELAQVLMDPRAKSDRKEMYYMYRDVHWPADEDVIRSNHIRYDITVIPPCMIGNEFNKTIGHYHQHVPGKELAYPEVYEVLHGQALFLIQKLDLEGAVVDVVAIKAATSDKIIYPPNYGHIIVNIGSDVLVTSNWVADNFESDYKMVTDKKGMAYYVVKSDQAQFGFEANKNYRDLPAIKITEAADNMAAKMLPSEPMYGVGVRTPIKLEFLTKPEKLV